MIQNILTGMFILIMAANVITLVHHHRMMRALEFVLNGLIESQRVFNELVEADRRRGNDDDSSTDV